MKYSTDLIWRVRCASDRVGYCFLSSDELSRLFGSLPDNQRTRHRALLEFAAICGAEVETTPNLKSARFVPANRRYSPESFFLLPQNLHADPQTS